MRYLFFINPAAGKGKAQELLVPAVEKYFAGRNDYEIIVTTAQGDAQQRSEVEAQKGDEVTMFACGGDGTFFEVLNGTYKYKNVTLGVIPCGSGNDFLKTFEATEPFSDVCAQMEGKAVPMDAVMVDDICCMNICSLGMDAVVADDMTIFKNWPLVSGSMAYKLAIVKTFLRKIGMKVKITIDGALLGTFNCLFAVCGNGTTYGGGYKSCPRANPSDGKLEWLIVEKISKLKILGFLKTYEEGKHEGLPYVKSGQCECMELEAEREAPINIDGEIVHKKSVRFQILKSAVRVILPKGVYENYKVPSVAAAE